MIYKIQLKNAQILLKEHKYQCGDFMSVFKPHKVSSNAEYQRKWYQNHKENVLSTICNLNIKHLIENQHMNIIGPKKMSNFHQIPHQQTYVRRLCPNFLLTLLHKCLKRMVAQFVEN
jgi:hypothetical protein